MTIRGIREGDKRARALKPFSSVAIVDQVATPRMTVDLIAFLLVCEELLGIQKRRRRAERLKGTGLALEERIYR